MPVFEPKSVMSLTTRLRGVEDEIETALRDVQRYTDESDTPWVDGVLMTVKENLSEAKFRVVRAYTAVGEVGHQADLRVGRLPKNYGMFSSAGNRKVHTLIQRIFDRQIEGDGFLAKIFWQGVKRISKAHSEVYDTAVREAMFEALEGSCGRDTADHIWSSR